MAARFLHRAASSTEDISFAGIFSKAIEDARSNFQQLPMVRRMEKSTNTKQYDRTAIALSRQFANAMVLYLATSLLYVTHKYTVPYYFGPYGEWIVYYAKVAITFCYANVIANWLCVKCYESFVEVTRDRPEKEETAINMDEGNDKKQLPWQFCEECQLHSPPRAHHCRVCQRCVLKRDHHCFILGVCIGYWNQRFFIVLSFWLMLGCTLGYYLVYIYLRDNYFPTTNSYWEVFLPVTIFNCAFGDVSLDTVILMTLIYFLWLGSGMGISFFSMQFLAVTGGKTSHETFKNVRVRVNTRLFANLRSVFGNFWILNFGFPAHILFRQSGEATRWEGVTTY